MCEQASGSEHGERLASDRRRRSGKDRRVSAEDRAADRARALTSLFDRRPDLPGVYLPADHAHEAFLWSA